MSDIISRLRIAAGDVKGIKWNPFKGQEGDLYREAADEIERLRKEESETFLHYRKTIKECDVLEAEIERLKAELEDCNQDFHALKEIFDRVRDRSNTWRNVSNELYLAFLNLEPVGIPEEDKFLKEGRGD